MIFFKYLKFLFMVTLSFLIFFVAVRFKGYVGAEISNFVLLPIGFIILNYAFIKMILGYIKHFNNLIILYKEQLIVIKATLLAKDNLEIIDLHKVTKLDTYCRGIIANIIGYGTLVVEQQRDELREFWFIPDAHRAINYLKHAKHKTMQEGKKTYVVPDDAKGEKCDI